MTNAEFVRALFEAGCWGIQFVKVAKARIDAGEDADAVYADILAHTKPCERTGKFRDMKP